MRHIILFLSVLTASLTWSQATEKYDSPLAGFYRAEDLFEKQQYSAARKEFRVFVNDYQASPNDPFYMKALYYEGLSALEVYNNDAISLLEQFNKDYPESIYKYDIFFRIGKYYYQKKNYKKTIEWLSQLNRQKVEPENADEYFFKLGYSYFDEKQFPEAKSAFYEIKDATSQYGAPALYYYSHISYTDGSYQVALEGFEKLMSDDRFKSVVPYYITQIYYLQGKYQEVADFAPSHVDSLKAGEQVEMNHLIGDSYYKLGKFDEAVPYLEAYNAKASTTRDDDYELGYAYFKSSNYEKSIKYFDKVARTKDTLGQIALYHAAEAYMSLNDLNSAKKAFRAASQLDKDLMIQEDALYNYAVLAYKVDLNPYDEAVVALEEYLQKYPNSKRNNVVYQYLVNVYVSTKNYAKALESLDKLPNKDIKLKTAYQLVAFNRGVELFQKNDYKGAINAFGLVETYPISQEISAKAVYWTADAQYQLNDKQKAMQNYTKFVSMPLASATGLKADAYYNIGYIYVDRQDYTQTAEAFKIYLQQASLPKKKKADAHMRLADAQYMNRDNSGAISNYEAALALKSGYEDQALFYLSKLYLINKNREKQIQALQDIVNNYPRSPYVQSAVHDVALAYFTAGSFDKSQRYFEQIVKDYPTSIQVKDALHYIGSIYYRKKDYTRAESYFRRVLSDYGNDRATCKREVDALAELYEDGLKQLSKVEKLADEFPCADSIRFQVEDKFYAQAMKPYNDSAFSKAIPEFDAYIAKYPAGKYLSEIMNYKADALYRLNREAEAIAIYKTTLESPDDNFTESAAQRTAKYLYNSKNYEGALPYYMRLEKVAKFPENVNAANLGLMRCHFILENYANVAEYAQKVLQNSKITNTVKLEAEFAKGISLSKTGSFSQALPSLEYVVKNTTTVFAAEAKYTIAEGYYKQNDLTKTDSEIRALLKMKPAYNYWIAKSLMLQTHVLMQKKDLFQAEQTILSVIENYKVADDGILEEASILYDEVMQMKNEPKSIPEKGQTVIDMDQKTGGK